MLRTSYSTCVVEEHHKERAHGMCKQIVSMIISISFYKENFILVNNDDKIMEVVF